MSTVMLRGQTTAAPEQIKIITVYGDSMVPDFLPGERVLVDLSDQTPSPPGVFVVWDGFGLVIKRLEMVPYSNPPTVKLKSANEAYDTYERALSEVVINGRVIGKWKWT
jgi:phage repressor protein C with HTH and peptisase S24 domain